MGVRGLTTFIAKNSDKYMEYFELHNTYLIIDGNNLAAQLYRWHAKCVDCYGGDYDQYANTVRTFFQNFQRCNVTPLVIFDGCYENKKLKTIYDRVRDRVSATKRLNAYSEGSVSVFPLFLRELFSDVVISTGCKTFRCEFEADYEMACLAKTINAPILSYDSDFYIFDVLYIPFSGLDSVPRMKKDANGKTYHFMECRLYKVDNFLRAIGGMDKDVLPLLATVAGNDYIAAGVFKEFYAQLKMVKRKRMDSDQQRKIESLIKWLLNETYETAAKKILGRIKREHRRKLADQMEEVSKGYHCVKSNLLPHFGIEESHTSQSSIRKARRDSQIDLSTIPDDVVECSVSDPNFIDEESSHVQAAPGELNLEKIVGHFPDWFVHHYQSCKFPAWFMDIAVRNRYFFIPQMENHDHSHSHTISLELLSALHKILRSNVTNDEEKRLCKTELTYISRQGNNYIANTLLPFCTLQLPTLNEIPGMTSDELKSYLHDIVEMDATEVNDFLKKFENDWKLYVIGILFWAKQFPEVNKIHIYALVLSGITLNTVNKKVGYVRTMKELNRKMKNAPELTPYLNFIKEVMQYFYMDERSTHSKRSYDIYTIDRFARLQSALFHLKYINKLLLCPYDDFLISDFYNGTFIYNVFSALKRRADPLTFLKNMFAACTDIFNQFLQIAIEITCKLENIAEGNKKPRKRKNRQKSNDSVDTENKIEAKKSDNQDDASASTSYDPNNIYSVLTME
ncbi:protein asteroid [Atheta coriaria]|uniref:protein asteroid n=1 Tax=Dalotia coriaria TaxID=877792 RepID=UPI0031F39C29